MEYCKTGAVHSALCPSDGLFNDTVRGCKLGAENDELTTFPVWKI